MVEGIQNYLIAVLSPEGIFTTWNAGAALITGFAAQDILGQPYSKLYPVEAIAEDVPKQDLSAAREDGCFETQGWRVRKDASLFWATCTLQGLYVQDKFTGFSLIARDLTKQHTQDMRLRESEERFRLLIAGVKDYAIFMLSPQGHVLTWNDGAQFIKGYSAEEIIGSHFSKFYPPEAIARNLPDTELYGATMQGRFEDEGWRLRKDGSRFWANVIITAVRNEAGHLVGFSKITRNLTERRRHEEELLRSEERFRLLVDGVTEYAIMMLDADGFVSSWNTGAERIKGYTSSEILGKHVSYFYTSEDIQASIPWEELNSARTNGRVVSEGWRIRKDGTLFWASSVLTALKDPKNKVYGFSKVTQDLTQRRNAEALADTAHRMHEFIAMLEHELRNPLSPIRNAVTLMGRKGLKDPALEAMRQTIDRQSVQLTRLLDELLDVNRIARGKFSIDRHLIDFREVVNLAVEANRPLLEVSQHKLELALPTHPVPVNGDCIRLTQAVVNLLNNAVKYTPPKGLIRLSVAVRATEIELRVKDSGRGIERDMLQKIFELFVQIDPSTNTTLGGLGVGLALVRRVTELHGGSVQARSEGKDRGTEVTLRLPLCVKHAQSIPMLSAPQEDKPIRTLRVLVVDDNKDSADTMEMLLQAMGQEASAVYDGPSALAVAQTFKPDAIFLDIGMPGMSGYEVARAIRKDHSGEGPVLAAITGWGQEADKVRAHEAGFDYHFVKPMDPDNVRQLLEKLSSQGPPSAPARAAS